MKTVYDDDNDADDEIVRVSVFSRVHAVTLLADTEAEEVHNVINTKDALSRRIKSLPFNLEKVNDDDNVDDKDEK